MVLSRLPLNPLLVPGPLSCGVRKLTIVHCDALDDVGVGGLFAGEFEVIVSDEITRSQEFTLQAQPETTIELFSDTTICVDGTAELIGVSSLPDLTWHWSNGSTDSFNTSPPPLQPCMNVMHRLFQGATPMYFPLLWGCSIRSLFNFQQRLIYV